MTNQPPPGPRWDPVSPWPPPAPAPEPAPPKFSTGGKVVLAVLAVILGVCGLGAFGSLLGVGDASEQVSVQTTTRETFLPPETSAAPATTEAPSTAGVVATFQDPMPTTTVDPLTYEVAVWGAWIPTLRPAAQRIEDASEAYDLPGVIAACTAALPLLDTSPANFTDPVLAELAVKFLSVQRASWQACADGDIIHANEIQPTATALLREMTARIEELTR